MDELDKFVLQFTNRKIENVRKIGRRYFFAEEELYHLGTKISREPFSIGLFLGEKNKEFRPTPALLDMISKRSDRKVFISKKAEWLFLCGRDVFEESIMRKNAFEGLVLVQNELDENLGYGVLVTKGKKMLLKNLLDRGDYLRREN